MSQGYARPEYLVETEWVAQHMNDPKVRIVESDEDYLLYETGHIPGAVKVDWFTTLQHPVRRDFLSPSEFEKLCSQLGISNDTAVVFYGDKSNWFACYALWLFRYYGHENVKIMNGGRTNGRRKTACSPGRSPRFRQPSTLPKIRIPACAPIVRMSLLTSKPAAPWWMYAHPKSTPESFCTCPTIPRRAPRAADTSPGRSASPGRRRLMKPTAPSNRLMNYAPCIRATVFTPDKEIIAYCRIGERSSHTWFALTYLLGYPECPQL